MQKVYHYTDWQGLPLKVSHYSAKTNDSAMTLLYFHGGGLIYGQRDDLPSPYIKTLTDYGYHLLAFDYPLAPEVPISGIVASVEQAISWFKTEHRLKLGIDSPNYCLFGRSAGAYLSLLIGSRQVDEALKGLISFYGYYDLSDPAFVDPSPYYQRYPALPFMMLHQLTAGPPKSSAPITERFGIYLAYRQTGQWVKQLLGHEQVAAYSLTENALVNLPPTFLAASNGDQDVPYRISKKMASCIPDSTFYQVKGLPHDFDADSQQAVGQKAYQELIIWLDQLS